jgi:hypothetical protein
MDVTEAQRQLFESAKAAFGESSAEIFMNLNPNVEWNNLATKDDIARLEASTLHDFASLRSDIARLEASTLHDFASLRSDLARLEASTRDESTSLRSDLARLEASTRDESTSLRAGAERFQASVRDDFVRFESSWKATLAAELAALEVRMQNRFTTVLLASQGVMLAAITLMITLALR